METVKLKEYDLKRVIARARKEYGYINRGDEDLYYPQLGYMEHKIYDVYVAEKRKHLWIYRKNGYHRRGRR